MQQPFPALIHNDCKAVVFSLHDYRPNHKKSKMHLVLASNVTNVK